MSWLLLLLVVVVVGCCWLEGDLFNCFVGMLINYSCRDEHRETQYCQLQAIRLYNDLGSIPEVNTSVSLDVGDTPTLTWTGPVNSHALSQSEPLS